MTEDYWDKVKSFGKDENWGDPFMVHAQLVFAMQELRDLANAPIVIHCAFDTTGHSSKGYHPKGMAVDFHIVGMDVVDQFLLAEKIGLFGGIGLYGPGEWNNPGLHCDIGKKGRRWCRVNGRYMTLTSSFFRGIYDK